MITKAQVIDAIVLQSLGLLNTCSIARSLDLYASRGEFDGSYDSAVECLEQACYEIH